MCAFIPEPSTQIIFYYYLQVCITDGYQIVKTLVFPHVNDRCLHKNSARLTSPHEKKNVSDYKTSQAIGIIEYIPACIETKRYGDVSNITLRVLPGAELQAFNMSEKGECSAKEGGRE